MIERSNSTPRRATQITALVAAALFMENLDSTIIVTALPKWRDPSAPIPSH
jgi:hypothetical protein